MQSQERESGVREGGWEEGREGGGMERGRGSEAVTGRGRWRGKKGRRGRGEVHKVQL